MTAPVFRTVLQYLTYEGVVQETIRLPFIPNRSQRIIHNKICYTILNVTTDMDNRIIIIDVEGEVQ
ncbi:putative glycosyltransferase family 36 protein [Bacillus phage BCP8-2]|uniref:Putative glycosyltransferase family 36 protein n=1 Tax=Bacillus phage BCP8-2 TaxID=1129192 RepID=A0A0E3D9H5_9CAUD|nr:glycosyltransferase [Bacillus phage BCP8-2]AHJ87171.1 putative glycosyltransferase family 36 protein [Bacillus phage BCP8-2]